MNRILLTSTALVAFAGAAAAEISYSGKANLGYNDKVENGFYWSATLSVKAEQELNGGLTAGFSGNVKLTGNNDTFGSSDLKLKDYTLYLKSETAGLYFGDTKGAAHAIYGKNAGVKGMALGDFDSKPTGGTQAVLRGEAKMFGAHVGVSGNIRSGNGAPNADMYGYQAAAAYEMGNYKVAVAYQHGGFAQSKLVAARVETSFSGADLKVAAARIKGDYSVGAQISYPVGPVTATGYYAYNKVANDKFGVKLAYASGAIKATAYYDGVRAKPKMTHTVGLDASYDMGNGLVLKAGGKTGLEKNPVRSAYAGAEYDMGNGASLLASYGWDNVADADAKKAGNQASDDIGAPEYNEGATVAVSFKF